MESAQIEFKYLDDKNKCKSSVISKINNLKDIFNEHSNFKNLKNEIIKFLKEKKSIIVNICDNNYTIEEAEQQSKEVIPSSEEKPENNNTILSVIEENNQEPDTVPTAESDATSTNYDGVFHSLFNENPVEIIEYISVYSSDEEDNQHESKKIDTQTYFIDSDSEDESIFSQKKDKLSKKILNNMTILELKNIMREKNLKLSDHGVPLKKQDMIKSILKSK